MSLPIVNKHPATHRLWDVVASVLLASYCASGVFWIFACLAEVTLMQHGLAHELVVGVISNALFGLFAFVVAVWKGDELVEFLTERRRIRAWRQTGRLCSIQLNLSLFQAFASVLNDKPPNRFIMPTKERVSDGTLSEQFSLWSEFFRMIREKGGTLQDPAMWESLTTDEAIATHRIPWWIPIMQHLAKKLEDIVSRFHHALPEELHQAISNAILELELFSEQCGLPTGNPPHRAHTINVERAVETFSALAVLDSACTRWFRAVIATSAGETFPFKMATTRVIHAKKPRQSDEREGPRGGNGVVTD